MQKKIVIAPDSYKGCLTAAEVADAVADGVASALTGADIVKIPLADGGEGTVGAIAAAAGGTFIRCLVRDPLGRPVTAKYLMLPDGVTAVMECAEAVGLPLLKPEERNPELTGTWGVGEMIRDALGRGCRKLLVGLGGSSTNDGGMGMLSALGVRFFDKTGGLLRGRGADMRAVARIDTSGLDSRLKDVAVEAACDVDNPFYGVNGAAYVFAPQKGADADAVMRLDEGLCHLAKAIRRNVGVDLSANPGAGAAGGLGGAFMSFLGATMRPGIDIVLDTVGFEEKIKGADLVITGEGSLDRQSLMGKVLSGVLRRASARGVPVVSVAGQVADTEVLNAGGLLAAFCIQQGAVSLEEAMEPERACHSLCIVTSQFLRLYMQNAKR